MAKIAVVAAIDGGIHVKYGEIVKGRKYEIDEEDFGNQLFERPSPGWLSPHEKADQDRAQELEQDVGSQKYEAPSKASGGKQPKTPAVEVASAAEPKEG